MTDLNNPIYVRGYRLSSGADVHEFKPYRYGGDQPYEFPPAPPLCVAPSCDALAASRDLCAPHYHHHIHKGLPLDEPLADKRRAVFDPSRCGTPKGYQQHRRRDVPVCDPCREARNAAEREQYAAKKRKAS